MKMSSALSIRYKCTDDFKKLRHVQQRNLLLWDSGVTIAINELKFRNIKDIFPPKICCSPLRAVKRNKCEIYVFSFIYWFVALELTDTFMITFGRFLATQRKIFSAEVRNCRECHDQHKTFPFFQAPPSANTGKYDDENFHRKSSDCEQQSLIELEQLFQFNFHSHCRSSEKGKLFSSLEKFNY